MKMAWEGGLLRRDDNAFWIDTSTLEHHATESPIKSSLADREHKKAELDRSCRQIRTEVLSAHQ